MYYFAKKLLVLFFSLFTVITATFFLMHWIPGDPFIGEKMVNEEVLKTLHAYYGLDQSLGMQYLTYLGQLASGKLGISLIYPGHTVNEFIAEGLPISLALGLQALLVAVPCGIGLGALAALKRARWQDQVAMIVSTLAISAPNFVLSSFLQWVFAVKLHWLPVARWGGFAHTVLPTLALAAMPIAILARLTRSSLIEVLQQDYIKTARSKGLSEFQVVLHHGLRNALLPVVTYLGPVSVQILTGSFMVEKIFSIPGVGQWMVMSIQMRDYPMILGFTIFFSTGLMIAVFIVDCLYALLDPRIRHPLAEKLA